MKTRILFKSITILTLPWSVWILLLINVHLNAFTQSNKRKSDSQMGDISGIMSHTYNQGHIYTKSNLNPLVPEATRQHVFTGAEEEDNFGYSISCAGDVNGDGYDDIIIGAPYNDAGGAETGRENTGRAYIYFSGPNMDYVVDVILTGNVVVYFEADELFGWSVASAGDVNGDGYGDVIVGAPQYGFDDASGFQRTGRTYIYFGGTNMDNIADVTLNGLANGDSFGSTVSGAGDMNGDGYSDVIVGAPGKFINGPGTGQAYVFLGGTNMDNNADVIFTGLSEEDHFGWSVAAAGDVNNDGYSEVIVGSEFGFGGFPPIGRVYLYLGGTDMDSDADVGFGGFYYGTGAGDVNGDGYSDVIVGISSNPPQQPEAQVSIYFGGSNMDTEPDVIFTGEGAGYGFNGSFDGAGDINGDGYDDIILSGTAYFGGRMMDNTADMIFPGQESDDGFGRSVSNAGDVNGDGYGDILIGAPQNDTNGTDAGSVYLYLNSLKGRDITDSTFPGIKDDEYFGCSISCAGDVNGDGYKDIIVGASQNDKLGPATGQAYIYHGGPNMDYHPEITFTGANTGYHFGNSVSGAGDVNSDGYDDVIIGAYLGSGAQEGMAFIYFGGEYMDNEADVILTTWAEKSEFGRSVAGLGDVNGDGFCDVIVGARFRPQGFPTEPYTGRAYLYWGGSNMDNIVDVTFLSSEETFGTVVAAAGDVNCDGYYDIMVGAYSDDSGGADAGRAYIFFGGPNIDNDADITFTGSAENEMFGKSIDGMGDLNGDGFFDIIIGTEANTAYIHYGGLYMDNIADLTLTSNKADTGFGHSVAIAGDVNTDGYGDVVVTAGPDEAAVYFGGVTMDSELDILLTANNESNEFTTVAHAGDLNRDGCDDIIVGLPNTNEVYLYISSSPPIVPRIASVEDVPNDQGGKVTIRWVRSGYDALGMSKITDYVIQRSLPPNHSGYAWENLITLIATHDPWYAYTASTLYDSSGNTNGLFYFRIIARTANPLESWKSMPMGGYSVDNLAPLPVQNLFAEQIGKTSVRLIWNRNTTDQDIQHYAIYRSLEDDFTIDSILKIGTTVDSTFVDTDPSARNTNYYKVVTVDIHGNDSSPSNQVSVLITGVDNVASNIPHDFALHQNYPNPFNPTTTIPYALPKAVRVRLTIYGVKGDEIITLVETRQSAGKYRVEWNGKDGSGVPIASGIYLYRLEAGHFVHTRKMLFVR